MASGARFRRLFIWETVHFPALAAQTFRAGRFAVRASSTNTMLRAKQHKLKHPRIPPVQNHMVAETSIRPVIATTGVSMFIVTLM
jgi:hypothetical protein